MSKQSQIDKGVMGPVDRNVFTESPEVFHSTLNSSWGEQEKKKGNEETNFGE